MTDNDRGRQTELFGLREVPELPSSLPEVEYRPVPGDISEGEEQPRPVWRVRFTPATDPGQQFGLQINGEVVFGRQPAAEDKDKLIDLSRFGAEALGVSRRHVMLRPTTTNLFIVDLGSTNGTFRNGRPIGSHTPYSLVDRDIVTMGKLPLLIEIVERPSMPVSEERDELDLAASLLQIAKAITSQLDLDDALNQVAETARGLTSAGETGIWLVDETTGELLLEAQRGIGDEKLRRMRLPTDGDSLVGEVLRTNKPLRTSRRPGEEEIKVKTGYLVEALVYVPITLGGVTFGVLSAVHREVGKTFSRRDEQLLAAIADFAAIAIQNARLYHRTDAALERRLKELAALNRLSSTLSSSLNLNEVYEVLVEQVNRYWPVEAVNLFLVDEAGKRLRLHGEGGLPDEKDQTYSVARGIVGKVARSGKLTVANDVQSDPDLVEEIDAAGVGEARSLVCVPLRVQERIVGVLALLNKVDGNFTEEDVIRLRAFTSPMATAVENARLYAESERRRRAIQATAQTLPQPLLILDEEGQLLVTNDAAQRLLRTNMSDLFEAVSSGVGRTTEVEIGDQTFVSTVEHVDDVGTIVVMQDITYVKKLEADRSDFMHALSHDMRNPLTSIVGYTQVMKKTLPPDEKYRLYLERIRMSADRMLEMVNQLLQTVDAEDIEQLNRQPCQLRPILEKVLQDVEGIAMSKSITIDLQCRGEEYPLLADSNRLYHAILNLVENAIKYSPAESRVELLAVFDHEETIIRVVDEGPGIPEEDLPLVFEKYYRGAQAGAQAGNGLGLAVVRSIVAAHAGTVSAANRPEGGAEFTIRLPPSMRLPAAGEGPAIT
ncbi:MAG TPA: GAF domain-containing protein [Candidatus Sulfomarinibacteraceae bacterium]|nr:GAF domain-containing protein [Candidatus Sulfomarinibacteraceae bacterium]